MLWRINRSDPTRPQGRLIPADDLSYDPERRSILVLPGADIANNSEPSDIAGFLKMIRNSLSKQVRSDPNIDIYIYTYEQAFEDWGASKAYFEGRPFKSLYSMNVARDVLKALLRIKGEPLARLSKDELKQRLSQITCVTHCYGSIVQEGMTDILADTLQSNGWSSDDIREIMAELVVVNVAPVTHQNHGEITPTQFRFLADNDTTAIAGIHRSCNTRRETLEQLEACGYGAAASWLRQQPVEKDFRKLLVEYADTVRETAVALPKPVPRRLGHNQYSLSGLMPDRELRWVEEKQGGKQVERVLQADPDMRDLSPVVHSYKNFLYAKNTMGRSLIDVINNAVKRPMGIGDGHQLGMTLELSRALSFRQRVMPQSSERQFP